jgi:hypothetical protein
VHPVELRADATTTALCTGAIDASLLIIGHPSPLVTTQQSACPVNLVAITGPAIDKLVHYHLYYRRGTIPAEIYGITADVPTFGGRATLVTSVSADARVVAVVAKTVLAHVAELRTLHPELARLRAKGDDQRRADGAAASGRRAGLQGAWAARISVMNISAVSGYVAVALLALGALASCASAQVTAAPNVIILLRLTGDSGGLPHLSDRASPPSYPKCRISRLPLHRASKCGSSSTSLR